MKVMLSRLHFPVTALGPGRRIGMWFQGCSIRCAGCISRDTWDANIGETDLGAIESQFRRLAPIADGLTVSGGEPFDQPDALTAILSIWRSMSKGSVLIFTGRTIHEIEPWLGANPGLADAMVTGPFLATEPQTLALRGSDNQELHILTTAGNEFTPYERLREASDRYLDVTFDENGDVWFAGIPGRGDIAHLRRALIAAGHTAETSARAVTR